MILFHGTFCLRYWSVLFCSRNEVPPHFSNRTLKYLMHNLPCNRLILSQMDNPWPSYCQDFNTPDYFLRWYLQDRVCENNPQTREYIIKKEIRQIPQELLNRVVDNFNVWVTAVVCVCVCAYLFPSIIEASSDWNKTINVTSEIRPAMLCWGNQFASSTFITMS